MSIDELIEELKKIREEGAPSDIKVSVDQRVITPQVVAVDWSPQWGVMIHTEAS